MNRIGITRPWLAALMALAFGLGGAGVAEAAPASAATTPSEAHKLRRMDIMLMVTGLRCRTTADDFMEDYGRFTSSHMAELNEANAQLRAELGEGAEVSGGPLDRMSVVMANEYGAGHPWLSCHQLRSITQGLATVQGRATLVEVAGQLLERQPPILMALAMR
ncbi:S-adenosyl-L-homocysteine hydrolase [Novosphingobium resinovorum]|uniref:S-adenosyl-L-homocysteine hydrolase n=1 Tax=Novosphingobium resinovorum TaxID=158500 RepID=UPI002ED27297|nr:S-adenosyl-L-homocysteine hydrolase [Novosphingobium resinovorum]